MKKETFGCIGRKILTLLIVIALAVSNLSTTAYAALLGSDTTEYWEVYGAASVGNLFVYDDYVLAITSYSRAGSNIGIFANISAKYRYGGKDHYLYGFGYSEGGGASSRVELSLEDYPNAVFLEAQGIHEVQNLVNGVLLISGHWLDYTNWIR